MTFSGTAGHFFGAAVAAALLLSFAPLPARAGAQVEERLAPSVVAGLQRAIADHDSGVRDRAADWINLKL